MPQPSNLPIFRTDADGLEYFTKDVLLVLEINRREIEQGNIASVLERLIAIAETRESAMHYRESLVFQVEGYDLDHRELAEIPEVRAFFTHLTQQWPHWLWFLKRNVGAICLLLSLICKVRIHRNGLMAGTEFTDIEEMGRKMMDLFERGNAMFDAFGITEDEARTSAESACAELQ